MKKPAAILSIATFIGGGFWPFDASVGAEEEEKVVVRQLEVSYDRFDTEAFWRTFSDTAQMRMHGEELKTLEMKLREGDWKKASERVNETLKRSREQWKQHRERMDQQLKNEVESTKSDAD